MLIIILGKLILLSIILLGGPFCVSLLHFFHPRLLFLFLGLEMVLIPHLCNFVALFVIELLFKQH